MSTPTPTVAILPPTPSETGTTTGSTPPRSQPPQPPQQAPHERTASERQGEIWSTRIQQELLALTTDDAEASHEQTRAMLPPFVTLQQHHLDITNANCTVDFIVQVTVPPRQEQPEPSTKEIVIQMDVSLPKTTNGKIKEGAPSYPFVGPVAKLLKGQEHFPEGSLQNGDRIAMDIDWTPSLHLADGILNIALKVKESILQREPLAAAPQPAHDAIEDVAQSARRIATSLSTSLGKAFSPHHHTNTNDTGDGGSKSSSPRNRRKKSKKPMAKTPETINIGDEINLLEEPWVDAYGVYGCKAIRRPKFMADAMAIAEENEEQKSFSSPTAMFKSFTKSARNVMQETFLMITETHIIELKSGKLNQTTASVTFCISIDLMHKLKFRRGESVSLFFKTAIDDPMIYMCPDAGDVVHQIQSVLKRHGVKGKHTNAAAHKAIAEAMHLVQDIQTKELALKHDPSVERVNEIMDLYRQAAERFAVAGDMRHEEVVTHMRKFLALPLTTSILDGSFQKEAAGSNDSSKPVSPLRGDVPEGEVIERTDCQLEDDDHDLDPVTAKSSERKSTLEFEEKMNNLMKEAAADLEEFKLEGSESFETDPGLAEMASDLDSMMKQADAELAELLNS